jgi:hypothetical protein
MDGGISVVIFILVDFRASLLSSKRSNLFSKRSNLFSSQSCALAGISAAIITKMAAPNFNASRPFMAGPP